MNSIFSDISNKKEHPVQSQLNTPKKSIVTQWKLNKSLLNTRQVILLLNPTIDSALHTYTPGQLKQFRIKAINIALDSLKNFDLTKNIAPSTYVFTALQRLNRVRRLRLNIIHIPLSQVYLKNLVDKKGQLLLTKLGRLATDLLLSDATGISKKKLDRIKSSSVFNLSSAVNLLSGDSTFKVKGLTLDDYFNYVYSSVSPTDKKIMLWTRNKSLGMSNNLIAKKLKLSAGAVSQRKAKIQQMLGLVRGII